MYFPYFSKRRAELELKDQLSKESKIGSVFSNIDPVTDKYYFEGSVGRVIISPVWAPGKMSFFKNTWQDTYNVTTISIEEYLEFEQTGTCFFETELAVNFSLLKESYDFKGINYGIIEKSMSDFLKLYHHYASSLIRSYPHILFSHTKETKDEFFKIKEYQKQRKEEFLHDFKIGLNAIRLGINPPSSKIVEVKRAMNRASCYIFSFPKMDLDPFNNELPFLTEVSLYFDHNSSLDKTEYQIPKNYLTN